MKGADKKKNSISQWNIRLVGSDYSNLRAILITNLLGSCPPTIVYTFTILQEENSTQQSFPQTVSTEVGSNKKSK